MQIKTKGFAKNQVRNNGSLMVSRIDKEAIRKWEAFLGFFPGKCGKRERKRQNKRGERPEVNLD